MLDSLWAKNPIDDFLGGGNGNTVELSLCNRIRRAATLCRRGKNKFIVGMGMPTYSLIQQYWGKRERAFVRANGQDDAATWEPQAPACRRYAGIQRHGR